MREYDNSRSDICYSWHLLLKDDEEDSRYKYTED